LTENERKSEMQNGILDNKNQRKVIKYEKHNISSQVNNTKEKGKNE